MQPDYDKLLVLRSCTPRVDKKRETWKGNFIGGHSTWSKQFKDKVRHTLDSFFIPTHPLRNAPKLDTVSKAHSNSTFAANAWLGQNKRASFCFTLQEKTRQEIPSFFLPPSSSTKASWDSLMQWLQYNHFASLRENGGINPPFCFRR